MTDAWADPSLPPPPAVRISGPADLLDALPRMLGYQPAHSAVLVALRPPRGKVVLSMRLDLPRAREETGCAWLLAGHAQRAGAATAVLVVYDERPDLAGGRWRGASLTRAVRTALRQRGRVRLTDALAVREGRWRSLLCADEGCCPPAGRPLRGAAHPCAATAALVAEGATTLPSRAALAASVAAPAGASLAATLERQRAVVAELASRAASGCSGAALAEETVEAFGRALAAADGGALPDDEQSSRLVVGLADVAARDAVLARAGEQDTGALLALLRHLATRAASPADAPVLTALAWVAYARGDGTLANIAIDRALATDPGYSLARLVADALEAGLHPRELRRVSRQV